MPEILLIQPPIRDFYLTKKRTIPYGLASLATGLLTAGFQVDILDCLATNKSKDIPLPQEMQYLREYYSRPDQAPFSLFYQYRHYGYSYEHISTLIAKSKAKLVGISSLFTPYQAEALAVADLVKKHLPGAKVVLGGHHPTALPEEVLQNNPVDFIIRGEGEQALVQLALALKNNTSTEGIPGLCYRDPNGKAVISAPAIIGNPDDFPLPANQLIKSSFYQRKRKGSTVIMAGRGCNLKCSYCSVSADSFLPFRRRSLSAVIRELDVAVEAGARFIDFEDENLSIQRSWFRELLDTISARYQGVDLELRAMNGLLPTTLDDDTIQSMAKAGFKELNLSLCTISKDQLRRFSRPDVQSAFDRCLESAENHGLTAVGYVIIGAPWQQPEDSISDLIFLAARRVLAGLSVYYPSPGSTDYKRYTNEKIFPADLLLTRSTALPVSHQTTRLEAVTLLRLGRIINYMKALQARGKSRGKDEIGKKLIAEFLKCGKIPGIDENGEYYEQKVSDHVVQSFLTALASTTLRAAS